MRITASEVSYPFLRHVPGLGLWRWRAGSQRKQTFTRLTIGIMAVMAEHERRMISERTKAALAAAKRRGVKLGGDRGARLTAKQRALGRAALQAKAHARAADLAPTIKELQAAGYGSLRAIAAGLEERGIPAARGGKWSAVQVARLLEMTASPFTGASAADG